MTDQTTEPHALTFQDDKGARRSFWIALILLVAVVVWMGSGFVAPAPNNDPVASASEPLPVKVAIQPSAAKPVTLLFTAEGQARPDRDTALRAEASGNVEEVLAEKGTDVETGDVIARLSTDRATADLTRAEEELSRAQREFDNASELLDRGVATSDRVSQARVALANAQAQVTAAQDALQNNVILAPFAGRIEQLTLDAGEFVSVGSEVGRIVDIHPLTVELQVPQQTLRRIESGQEAEVSFITGETRAGRVSFVGTSASAATRTFLAEIEIDNADGAIPAGVSARISIPTGTSMAHFVPLSVISLDPGGHLGVKTVLDDKAKFYPVEVVRAEVDGIWISGLPEEVDLIVVGQGYVRDGEAVRTGPAVDITQ